jgi:LytS/YehU family sensor histidine kinase
MNSKTTAAVAMMSALGILLSYISLNMTPVLSTVGQGGAALDLSHIATFIAAMFGGPYVGAIVGFTSGIYAGYYFGYILGTLGLLSLIGLPLGKALTGLTAGFLYKKLKISSRTKSSTLTVPIILISYIPECIFTIAYFTYIVTFFYGYTLIAMLPIVVPKAWIEITVMSIIMGALAGNIGFKQFITRYLSAKTQPTSKPQMK